MTLYHGAAPVSPLPPVSPIPLVSPVPPVMVFGRDPHATRPDPNRLRGCLRRDKAARDNHHPCGDCSAKGFHCRLPAMRSHLVNQVSAKVAAANTGAVMTAFILGSGLEVVAGLTSALVLSAAMVVSHVRGVH